MTTPSAAKYWPAVRRRRVRCAAAIALVALAAAAIATLPAAGKEPDLSARLPRIPPRRADEAAASFRLADALRIELVAAEPLVVDPVAIDFDAAGRVYVVEMRDYSEQADEHLGRVRLLEDADGDGRSDRSTVFAEGLSWPTAVLCWDGGVFVGAAPDLLYLKDTTGDGRADARIRVLTGLGRSNVQGLVNSLRWGLDNRVHAAVSVAGAELRVLLDHPRADQARPSAGGALRVSGRDFSFDPRAVRVDGQTQAVDGDRLNLRPESGGGQHGMCFDDWGRKFVCSNSNHLQLVLYEDRHVARNPRLQAPPAAVSIAADGPAADVFRTSPIESWRIVRTELRVAGEVPGPIEGGGRPAGYFTGATGVTIYRGDAVASLRGLALVGDVGGNLVHRKRLEQAGASLIGRRIDERSELLASDDIWFRPVQMANAPDGTLWVLDMYREVIEHPQSLPPIIKRHLDLTSGRDRGRLWRIVPGPGEARARPPAASPELDRLDAVQLVPLLAHDNGWHREAAARLLYERQDRRAIEPLRQAVREFPSPLGRMHALYALSGLDALTADEVLAALGDSHPGVRRHAVRLAERHAADAPAVAAALYRLASDDDLLVRYQLAFTLGEVASPAALRALAEIAARDAEDRWIRLAVLSSAHGRSGELLQELLVRGSGQWRHAAAAQDLIALVAEQVGLEAAPNQVALVLSELEGLPADERQLAARLTARLTAGLARVNSPLVARIEQGGGRTAELLKALEARAAATALDRQQPPAERAEAIGLLAIAPQRALQVAPSVLASNEPHAVQLAAVRLLGRIDDDAVARILLEAWPELSPQVRREAAEALLARPERIGAVLDAMEAGNLRPGEFDPARLRLLSESSDEAIRKRAATVLGAATSDVVERNLAEFRGALDLAADAQRGRAVFQRVCAACHRLDGQGHEVGPDLAAIGNRGREAILMGVLDPNREVNPAFVNYSIATVDGRTLTGVIAAESANSLTLRRAEGIEETVLRSEVEQLRSTGLSLMPEALVTDLTPQDVADLIEYLSGPR